MSRKGFLYVVSAPSGAGKTTLCSRLSRLVPAVAYSVSHTTRSPRQGESDGVDYYFVSPERFKEMADGGGFVEWAAVHGHLYGTSRAELERLFGQGKDVILDIDTQGAAQIKRSGTPGVFIFILPPSMEELERRLRGRGLDDEGEIKRRLGRAAEEIKSYREYRYVIVNENLDAALDALMAVVAAERHTVDNIEPGWMKERFGVLS